MNEECIYSDGEIVSRGKHSFDKDGFCNICGMTREQAGINDKALQRKGHDAIAKIADWSSAQNG